MLEPNKYNTSTEHTAMSLCTKLTSSSKWSQNKSPISRFETSEDLEAGFTFLSPVVDSGTKVIGRLKAFEVDFGLSVDTFFANASVRANIQSAADTESRDGNSNPSCKVL